MEFENAVKAIENTEAVMYRHGVWNPYEVEDTDFVKKAIMNSGYGATVKKDSNNVFYVSIPCDSDMW